MNSKAYISALGNMLINGIDKVPVSQVFVNADVPDTGMARFLAGIPCAIALGLHYLAYTIATITFAIGLASIPFRAPGHDGDSNPLYSKHAYRTSVSDMLDHLGLEKEGFINYLFVEVIFPLINFAAITVAFGLIGWAGFIAFLPATVSYAAQATNLVLTMYNIAVPLVTSFPEITIMGTAIALAGLVMKGFDWLNGRMEAFKKNKEGEQRFVHETKQSPVQRISTTATIAVKHEAENTQAISPAVKKPDEGHNGPEKTRPS